METQNENVTGEVCRKKCWGGGGVQTQKYSEDGGGRGWQQEKCQGKFPFCLPPRDLQWNSPKMPDSKRYIQ